jgi:hypothetical protein
MNHLRIGIVDQGKLMEVETSLIAGLMEQFAEDSKTECKSKAWNQLGEMD